MQWFFFLTVVLQGSKNYMYNYIKQCLVLGMQLMVLIFRCVSDLRLEVMCQTQITFSWETLLTEDFTV